MKLRTDTELSHTEVSAVSSDTEQMSLQMKQGVAVKWLLEKLFYMFILLARNIQYFKEKLNWPVFAAHSGPFCVTLAP